MADSHLRVLLGAMQRAGVTALRVCEVERGGQQTLPVGEPWNISVADASVERARAAVHTAAAVVTNLVRSEDLQADAHAR